MNKRIRLVRISALKPHENISKRRYLIVSKQITEYQKIISPILVEKKHLIILDGHHRVCVLKHLGYKKIPAVLVDYNSRDVVVKGRRKRIKVNKSIVLKKVINGQCFPAKTTKHILKQKIPIISINLKQLI